MIEDCGLNMSQYTDLYKNILPKEYKQNGLDLFHERQAWWNLERFYIWLWCNVFDKTLLSTLFMQMNKHIHLWISLEFIY